MSEVKTSLAERLNRLQTLRSSAIAATEPLAGEWSQGCQAFPASYAQARLWFLQQLQRDLTAYHLPALWRLSGQLDREALAQALTDLITRHPTLRTSFQLHGSEVLQLIHPPPPIHLELESLGDRNPEAVIQAWLQQEDSTPFDLASGLLLRVRLLAVAEQEHVLLINHHHIASDGWSLSLLSSDLTALYNARRNHQAAQLQPLQVNYHDYAVWQRQRLKGPHRQKLHDFWMAQLTGLEPLELPTDHPRPATPSHQGASHSFRIEPALLTSFEEFCRSEGATLQMGLLALVALLLQRYSRQDDFAIGIPIWGRNHPDLEHLIGFFINTLPIRARFSADLSFRQLLNQVKTTSINAYDHQDLPFEQIVEALNLQRDTSRNPLVQVMLQLIELPAPSLNNLDGLAVEPIQSSTTTSRLDLEFFLWRDPDGGLNTTITYATDLFCADRIQRLASHLLSLLASAAQAPDLPAACLNLLPETERQLIQSWQHGPTINIPDLCIHQLFEQQVARTPDSIALIFEEQQLTYSQLNARANQLAHHLLDLGVGPEVIVAVCLERSVELIVALLAILKAGGAYLPLDPAWPQERTKAVLEQAESSLLLTLHGSQNPWAGEQRSIALPDHALKITDDGHIYGFKAQSTTHPFNKTLTRAGSKISPAQLDHPAYLLFTSGSTGKPKGVLVTHRALADRCQALASLLPINRETRVLAQTTPVFDISILELLIPLAQGASIVITPAKTSKDFSATIKYCHSSQITLLQATPSALDALINLGYTPTPGMTILAGGEALPQALASRLTQSGAKLINGYGPSETTIYTSLARIKQYGIVSLGTPLPNTVALILDPSGHPCPIGIPGELHIGGSGLARGYLNNPELTADQFIPDPFSEDPSARLYKSGDLVSWNPDGTLAFHGRIDQQIKLRGFRIEPGEIETNLLAHPGVAQAAVVLRHDDPANARLIAYWVPQQLDPSAEVRAAADNLPAEQLRTFLAERLPEFMLPAAFVALEALPLTTNGKLDRKALPAPSFAGDLTQRVAPSTDLERRLHAIWTDVLGHSDFGITDNFWLVGGHSLAGAGLGARIERELGKAIPLEAIFRCPTISGQANLLLNSSSHSPGHLVTLQPMGSRPPLHVVHGWGGRVGGFTNLARALAPHRPVLGLQASASGTPPDGASVTQLADAYAEEILAAHRGGPIHLMGYSAGGWYAYAVAAALLQRGAPLGVVAILDTNATTRIHRRLGMALFGGQVGSRLLPALRGTLRPPTGQRRRRYVVDRLRSLNQTARLYLRMGLPGPKALNARLRGIALPPPDSYVQLLFDGYRPPRLPLKVDLFAPQRQLLKIHSLWCFYARGGVHDWPLFDHHADFIKPELASQLARALETALQRVEEGQPAAHIPVMQ